MVKFLAEMRGLSNAHLGALWHACLPETRSGEMAALPQLQMVTALRALLVELVPLLSPHRLTFLLATVARTQNESETMTPDDFRVRRRTSHATATTASTPLSRARNRSATTLNVPSYARSLAPLNNPRSPLSHDACARSAGGRVAGLYTGGGDSTSNQFAIDVRQRVREAEETAEDDRYAYRGPLSAEELGFLAMLRAGDAVDFLSLDHESDSRFRPAVVFHAEVDNRLVTRKVGRGCRNDGRRMVIALRPNWPTQRSSRDARRNKVTLVYRTTPELVSTKPVDFSKARRRRRAPSVPSSGYIIPKPALRRWADDRRPLSLSLSLATTIKPTPPTYEPTTTTRRRASGAGSHHRGPTLRKMREPF